MCRRRVFPDSMPDIFQVAYQICQDVLPRDIKIRDRTIAMTKSWRYVGLVLLIFSVIADANNAPLVETRFGTIRGNWSRSARNLLVANFLGIPYAKPPIGELRFKAPQPWETNWTRVRDATKDGSKCIQMRNGVIEGKEDCLYLNVYVPLVSNVPKRNVEVALPVMVYIHGGGFLSGSSDSKILAPDYLMDQGVILVTMNYRLHVLGFFSTANEASPGNYGLKDIIMALRWVNENIKYFKGDPNSVTLVGNSAGAAAVHLLALSNKTEGLFNKYIMHSGTSLAAWGIHSKRAIKKTSLEMARILGCGLTDYVDRNNTVDSNNDDETTIANYYENYTMEDYQKIMICMRFISARKMLRAMAVNFVWRSNPSCIVGPTIEDESDEAVITMHPRKIIEKHLFRDMPSIMGIVSDEGLVKTHGLHTELNAQDELIENFEKYIPYVIESHEIIADTRSFGKALKSFYFHNNIEEELLRNITELVGDGLFVWPTYETVESQARVANSSIYFYLFAYEGTFTSTFSSGIPLHYGVSHSDDMNYIFPMFNNLFADLMLHNTGNDWTVINIMTEMWTNFMRNGIPSAWSVIEWPDYRHSREYLKIGDGGSPNVTVESDFLPERMEFWMNLMDNYSTNIVELDTIVKTPPIDDEDADGGSGIVNRENLFLICLSILISQSRVSII